MVVDVGFVVIFELFIVNDVVAVVVFSLSYFTLCFCFDKLPSR